MNNEQFRKLVAASTAPSGASNGSGEGKGSAAPSARFSLGARKPTVGLTPRSVAHFKKSDFTRQPSSSSDPKKTGRATSTPKGAKLAQGYTDRTKERRGSGGGDAEEGHVVKGLDFEQLAKAKRRVQGGGSDAEEEDGEEKEGEEREGDGEEDVDNALDRLEVTEVTAVEKETKTKKGQLSTAALVPGKKRTRDQILAEMKAAREAAAAAAKQSAEPALGSRFKKIGPVKAPGTRIERDSRGREVLIIVDEDGHEKRKVRKTTKSARHGDAEEAEARAREAFVPDKNTKVLGMEVPEAYRQKAKEEDEDGEVNIFDDVGDDYDPLAGLNDKSDESEEEEGELEDTARKLKARRSSLSALSGSERDSRSPEPSQPKQPPAKVSAPSSAAAGPRNYFGDSRSSLPSSEPVKAPSLSDPAILAALQRAAKLQSKLGSGGGRESGDRNGESGSDEDEDEESRKKREAGEHRRKMLLQADDRDALDMDMGFGMSRLEDEEDLDEDGEGKVKLSVWGGEDDEDGRRRGGKEKRKRPGKKRKGDKNSAADVLRVIEQRKTAGQ